MNSTQNKKIEQVKETTMIVGIDVGSEKHYFRAFNWRGIELTRKPIAFSNSMEGFNSFYNTIVELMQKSKLEEALVGIEPTGHYWFDLGQFMGEKNIKFVMVNPHHVHKTKELDDNSPSKNDRKDPRIIAGLVRDGRYFYSYMPTGVYAELRNASNRGFVLVEEQTRAKNRLQKWIAVYFPEYKGIYTHMLQVVVRVKSAAVQQRIADTDLCSVPKGHLDVKFIIFFEEGILKDVENVPLIVIPIFLSETFCQIFDLYIQRVRSFCAVVGRQHRRHCRQMLLTKLPQIHIPGMCSFAGIRHIEDIAKPVAVSSGVNQGNALGTAAYKASHGVVPHIILGTGRRVRSLCMNHDLLMIRVLIQPRCCFQEGLPAFQTACQLALCLL